MDEDLWDACGRMGLDFQLKIVYISEITCPHGPSFRAPPVRQVRGTCLTGQLGDGQPMLVAQVLGGVNGGLVSTGSVDGGPRITVVELKVHASSQLMSAF